MATSPDFRPPGPAETWRVFDVEPLRVAGHVGGVSFDTDSRWSHVELWNDPDVTDPPYPAGSDMARRPHARLGMVELSSGRYCQAGDTGGRFAPGIVMAPSTLWRRIGDGLLHHSIYRDRWGLLWRDEPCGKDRLVELPEDEGAATIASLSPDGETLLLDTAERYLLLDAADQSRPRAIDGLRPLSWAQVEWAPGGESVAILARRAAAGDILMHHGGGYDYHPGDPHVLALVDVATGRVRQEQPLHLSWGMSDVITDIHWLNDEECIVDGADGQSSWILGLEAGRTDVARRLGWDPSDEGRFWVEAVRDDDAGNYHLLARHDDGPIHLYHSESGEAEVITGTGQTWLRVDGELEGLTTGVLAGGAEEGQRWSRPLDPPRAERDARVVPCLERQVGSPMVGGSTDPGLAREARYAVPRLEGAVAIRDSRTCELDDLVAITGVSEVQQAHLAPDDRHLVVVGRAREGAGVGLYLIDLSAEPGQLRMVAGQAPFATREPDAPRDPSPAIDAVDGGSIPYDPAEWEPEPTEAGRPPLWFRRRDDPHCRVRGSGGIAVGRPNRFVEIRGLLIGVNETPGFGTFHWPVGLAGGGPSPSPVMVEVHAWPRSWSDCDAAIRQLLSGIR